MAKAASPIRLQEELMQAATLVAKRYHRSTAEQIEYWADMGRRVAAEIDPDSLLSIASGLSRIIVEPVYADPIAPHSVFSTLEQDRASNTLASSVTSSVIKYQISETHPGYLEQVEQDNKTTTGQFKNGEFLPLNKSAS